MATNKFTDTLIDLGLSENEAKVYFASLSLGPTTVLKLARTAGVKRTTAYSVIETLKQKDLMSFEIRGFKTLYTAEDPEKLETILEARREKFKKAFPEFSALYNLKGGESYIKYYEGLKAMKATYEGILKSVTPGDWYLVISHSSTWEQLDRDWFYDYIERRAKINLHTRVLLQESSFATHYKKYERNYNSEAKILPKDTSISVTMIITPRRIVIHQLVAPYMAIAIENKSIIQLQKEMFEIIWKSLPD